MIHLTPADYTRQPWKNGRGVTTELWRLDHDGQLLVRISCATVAEDGPFSLFPGIERNLTVTSGKGFRLVGERIDLRCDPLVPVAFPGDVAVEAVETGGAASDDFNVLTARALGPAEVWLPVEAISAGNLLALYAPEGGKASGIALAPGDLLITDGALAGLSGRMIAARLPLDRTRIPISGPMPS
jgi:uncharacterized protein